MADNTNTLQSKEEAFKYHKDVLEIAQLSTEDTHNQIIELEGDYYFVGEDEDWAYKDECPLDYSITDFEANYILATRRIIGTGTKTYKQDKPYIFERFMKEHDFKNNENVIINQNRRWEANSLDNINNVQSEQSFLPDSEVAIYKEIKDKEFPEELQNKEHALIYDTELDKYYCIRQCCPACNNENVVIHKKKRDLRIMSIDLAAQEPRCNVMNNPDEKNWRVVFQNDTLKKDYVTLFYVNIIFKEQFRVDIDNDVRYQFFLDKKFFLNKTFLYELNTLCMKIKLEPDNLKIKQNLTEKIAELWDLWNNFISE